MIHPREFITWMEQWEEDPLVTEVLDHMGTLKNLSLRRVFHS